LVSQKYAYFIGCMIGMKKDWLGQNLSECHVRVKDEAELEGRQLTTGLFVRMAGYFNGAVEKTNLPNEVKSEFM